MRGVLFYIFVVSFFFVFCFVLSFFVLVFVFVVSCFAFTGIAADTVPKEIAAKAIMQHNFFMVFEFNFKG